MANKTEKSTADAVEQKVVALAEQMGRLIGTVQARAEGWLDRTTLQNQLTGIRESAAEVLTHLNPRGPAPASESGQAGGSGQSSRRRTSAAAAKSGRSGGKVDAPGKKHRGPMPSARGAKHSDERIAKLRTASEVRRRRKGGS